MIAKLSLNPKQVEQLMQIGNSIGGADAGSLINKSAKAELFDLGLITPKYGAVFTLTEDGAMWLRYAGIERAPFSFKGVPE